jgi:hypothetical protein
MTAISSIFSVFMLTVIGITIFTIRSILRSALRDPEKIMNEMFKRKYGYLVQDLRSVGQHSPNKDLVIQWKVFYLFRWTTTICVLVQARDY